MTEISQGTSSQLHSNMKLPTRKIQMSLAKARLFSLPNESFHTHDKLAQKIGLSVAAPQGLMAYGYLSQMATEFFGEEWANGGELNISFTNLINRNDLLSVNGNIAKIDSENGRRRITLDLWVENERGVKIAAGQAIGFKE